MPNPDAAIAPGSDAALPHPMAYDVTADAGYVRDTAEFGRMLQLIVGH